MVAKIRAAGGEVYGITSEPNSLAIEAEDAWNMTIPVVGDPHHEIRRDLKDRGWIDIFYNSDCGHLRARDWVSHPKGYYQPAVVAIDKSQRVLYKWRCVPKYSNMSGAGARPEPRYVWKKINQAVATFSEENACYDEKPFMGSEELSWFKFLLVMVGHGWFIRPKAFPLLRDGGKDKVSPKDAMRRWQFFLMAWVLALVVFPVKWVAVVTALWMILLLPGLREIHRQFQNE